jgi:diketogulonate reductase-like aldo/keto reductase
MSKLTEAPRIGQGTWQMENDDRDEAVRALRRGLDLGLVHVDTAELYGSGVVEEMVGEALAGRRDQVFLASKVMPQNATYEGTLEACAKSLRRLRTDRLDLYMLHWAGSHPLEETFRAFEKLRADGKVLAWGVSNFDVPELEEALAIAGPGVLGCNQVLHHLGERAIEHRVLPWCRRHGVPVVGYSPFGSGRFPTAKTGGGRALAEVAARHGATARQVALAFLAGLDTFTIPKAARVPHVEDNAGALGVHLTQDDVGAIDAAFPRGKSSSLPHL